METVTSADGTVIAYDRTGDGPILIVSVGAFCTRHTFVAPAELTRRFTVVTYDRRGRGDSGDTAPFAPEREYEDLAAVAAATGTDRRSCSATHPARRLRCALPPGGCLSRASPPTRRRSPTTRPRRRVPTRPPASANWSPRGGNAMRLSFG